MNNENKGFISTLILIIVSLALLKYFFDWSIFDAIESEKGRETVEYIREVLNTTWAYIRTPVLYVWDKITDLLNG